VTVVGAGNVGLALGEALAAAGQDVRFGVRDPSAVETDAGPVGEIPEAAAWAETVVLAVPGAAAVDAVASIADEVTGKVLVDCTNRMGGATSVGEELKAAATDVAVAKAFNTIGFEHLGDPEFDGTAASMFVCGDEGAREVALGLASDAGFDPVDVGPLSAAGHLEALARFWIYLAGREGRDIGFRLLRGA
jgi:hypothetical protein